MNFKRLLLLFICITVSWSVFGQEHEQREGQPDLPGTFLLEFGSTSPQNAPDNFDTGLWGSRTFNIYYQYDITIPVFKKHFSLAPGIGLGLDRFKFTNNYAIAFESGNLTMSKMGLDITKSQFVTNYFDIPIELKYTKNPEDPRRSLKVSVGFRGGVLINAYTKISYTDDEGSEIRDKSRRDWNVNTFRYGAYGKIGVGNFSLFAYSNISTLFESENGPDKSNINTLTFGLSFAGF